MARKGNSLQSLINETPSVEQLAWNHNADISASVYKRMRELNITQGTLAKRMKMHPSQPVSYTHLTLPTKLEV